MSRAKQEAAASSEMSSFAKDLSSEMAVALSASWMRGRMNGCSSRRDWSDARSGEGL